MAVKIRFSRLGKKNRAYYRIAVFDSQTRRDGTYIESLGTYDPIEKEPTKKIKLNKERYDYWLSKGAKPTEAIERLLKHTGIVKP